MTKNLSSLSISELRKEYDAITEEISRRLGLIKEGPLSQSYVILSCEDSAGCKEVNHLVNGLLFYRDEEADEEELDIEDSEDSLDIGNVGANHPGDLLCILECEQV